MLTYVLLSALLGCTLGQEEGPIVRAPSGPVQGVLRHHNDVTTSNFLGVPYAEPPVGERRFELPESLAPWTEVRNASAYGNSCVQDPELSRGQMSDWMYDNFLANLTYSEDCLSLNVFVPGDMTSPQSLPVMVYFHGGGFIFGHTAFRLYEGDWLATAGDVIVVTVNYRLSILGFFTTGTDRIRGNAGLYDQHVALEWIRDNIASFGGDPNRVTLFGQSAGGASVTYHDVSPLSRELFHRVIIQSGSSQDLGGRPEDYRNMTEELAWELDCWGDDDDVMLACLKQVPVDTLLEYWVTYAYFPCIDGTFIPDIMYNMYDSGNFNRVPHLIGTTSGEGTLPFLTLDQEYLEEGLSEIELDIFMTVLIEMTGYENFDQIYEALETFYFADGDISDYLVNILKMVEMISDFVFESPKGVVTAALTKYDVEAYLYYYSHR